MSKKQQIIHRIKYSALVPQIAVFLFIGLVLQQLKVDKYWLISLSLYLLLTGYLKIIIPKSHRKGLFYLKKGEFEGSAFAFMRSYQFFKKHEWLDKYRALTLLSLSAFSYSEMALMNIIYCYERINKPAEAKKYFSLLKAEYPDNPYSHKK